MQLIRNPKVSSVFPWSRIVIIRLKYSLPIDSLIIILILFYRNLPNRIHRQGFISRIELIKVHSRSSIIILTLSIKSWCFGVEVTLTTHVMTHLLAWLDCVLTWSWYLLFSELFAVAEAIRHGLEARINRFYRDYRLDIVPRTWEELRLLFDWFLLLPGQHPLGT